MQIRQCVRLCVRLSVSLWKLFRQIFWTVYLHGFKFGIKITLRLNWIHVTFGPDPSVSKQILIITISSERWSLWIEIWFIGSLHAELNIWQVFIHVSHSKFSCWCSDNELYFVSLNLKFIQLEWKKSSSNNRDIFFVYYIAGLYTTRNNFCFVLKSMEYIFKHHN